MTKNILLLETVSDDAMTLLEKAPDVSVFTGYESVSLKETVSKHPIHAIITRGKGQVRSELMDQCPELSIISRCGVGLDNIDVVEATKRNIKVVNAPNSNSNTIAEHTISLLLSLQRNLYHAFTMVKEGHWADRGAYKGDEIHGKTLGILGMGNIGKKVAKIAEVLGMHIIYWSANKKDVPYQYVSLEKVLAQSDCISIHLPLVAETEHLIDASALKKMKPSAFLVNTARGKIIDQKALYEALTKKIIAGFAADVLTDEPPEIDDPLISLDNVLATPHIGSLTTTTYNLMCTMTIENTLTLLRDKNTVKSCVFNQNELIANKKIIKS